MPTGTKGHSIHTAHSSVARLHHRHTCAVRPKVSAASASGDSSDCPPSHPRVRCAVERSGSLSTDKDGDFVQWLGHCNIYDYRYVKRLRSNSKVKHRAPGYSRGVV